MNDDTIPALILSARGGHGLPSSKLDYIHQIEDRLAEYCALARPAAWQPTIIHAEAAGLFPALCDGQLAERPPIPDGLMGHEPLRQSKDLTLDERAALLYDVQRKLDLDVVAQNANVERETVELVVQESVEALIETGLASEEARLSPLAQRLALVRWKQAAAVAQQDKHAALKRHLGALLAESDWRQLSGLWRDWKQCRRNEWVSVLDGPPAARLVQCLLAAGVPHDSLAIVSAPRGAALPRAVAELGLHAGLPVKHYRGRPRHRLVLTAHGVCAAQARGGAVTMTGLHWCFVVLASALIARKEL